MSTITTTPTKRDEAVADAVRLLRDYHTARVAAQDALRFACDVFTLRPGGYAELLDASLAEVLRGHHPETLKLLSQLDYVADNLDNLTNVEKEASEIEGLFAAWREADAG